MGMREARDRGARGACRVLLLVFIGALATANAAAAACVSNASLPATGVLLAGGSHASSYKSFRARTSPSETMTVSRSHVKRIEHHF